MEVQASIGSLMGRSFLWAHFERKEPPLAPNGKYVGIQIAEFPGAIMRNTAAAAANSIITKQHIFLAKAISVVSSCRRRRRRRFLLLLLLCAGSPDLENRPDGAPHSARHRTIHSPPILAYVGASLSEDPDAGIIGRFSPPWPNNATATAAANVVSGTNLCHLGGLERSSGGRDVTIRDSRGLSSGSGRADAASPSPRGRRRCLATAATTAAVAETGVILACPQQHADGLDGRGREENKRVSWDQTLF